MQFYIKPELNIEAFDVDDVIMMSSVVIDPSSTTTGTDTTTAPIQGPDIEDVEDWAPAPMTAPEEADIMGAPNPIQESELPFDTEVWGGNPIQEGLNALYENFLQYF